MQNSYKKISERIQNKWPTSIMRIIKSCDKVFKSSFQTKSVHESIILTNEFGSIIPAGIRRVHPTYEGSASINDYIYIDIFVYNLNALEKPTTPHMIYWNVLMF